MCGTGRITFLFRYRHERFISGKAGLMILETEGLGICQQCRQQMVMESSYSPCIYCGSLYVKLIQGMDENQRFNRYLNFMQCSPLTAIKLHQHHLKFGLTP